VRERDTVEAALRDLGLNGPPPLVHGVMLQPEEIPATSLVEEQRRQVVIGRNQPDAVAVSRSDEVSDRLEQRRPDPVP
jgi:hypothetical protein